VIRTRGGGRRPGRKGTQRGGVSLGKVEGVQGKRRGMSGFSHHTGQKKDEKERNVSKSSSECSINLFWRSKRSLKKLRKERFKKTRGGEHVSTRKSPPGPPPPSPSSTHSRGIKVRLLNGPLVPRRGQSATFFYPPTTSPRQHP